MPAPIIAAGVGGLSSYMASKQQDKATNAQSAAQQQAMQFERDKFNEDKRRYDEAAALRKQQRDQAYADYQQRYRDWQLRNGWRQQTPQELQAGRPQVSIAGTQGPNPNSPGMRTIGALMGIGD